MPKPKITAESIAKVNVNGRTAKGLVKRVKLGDLTPEQRAAVVANLLRKP